MTENGIGPNSLTFFGHFKTTSVCDRQIPKKQVETQSREMFLIFRTTPSGVLQPLRWRCVDFVIHHERDVREE